MYQQFCLLQDPVHTIGNPLRCSQAPPPRGRGPSRLDHNVKEIGSGARTKKNNLQAVHLLRVMIDKPTLYDQLIIGKMLQSDLPPPYTQ